MELLDEKKLRETLTLLGDEIKKLRGILGNGIAEATTDAPSCRSFEEIIVRLNREINDDTGSMYFQQAKNNGMGQAPQFGRDVTFSDCRPGSTGNVKSGTKCGIFES